MGRTKGFGPSLVPQALRNRVPNVPAIGAAVQVRGGAQGRLYRVTGPRRYEILFAPALFVPGAVAVVACVGPPRGPPDGGVFSACNRVLGSLQVAHPFPLDPRVLVALCRPLGAPTSGLPATNQQIADELHLSVPAVKKRLRSLFVRFELEDLAQNEKRGQLAAAAIRMGVVVAGEL